VHAAEQSSETDNQPPASAWYLRSLADQDTHCGRLRGDGTVQSLCGARFTLRPTLQVVGPPPGELAVGELYRFPLLAADSALDRTGR
jgi:hypothetical protein